MDPSEDGGVEGLQHGAYLRKMALDGYCVRLDLEDVREPVRLLRICSNNLNQYAKKGLILAYIRYKKFLKGLFGLAINILTRGREMYKVKKNEEIRNYLT